MEIVIRLNKLQFHAPVGWYEEERLLKSDIEIDVEIKTEIKKAEKDELMHTVNYELVYAAVEQVVMIPAKLLETVADRAASEILSSFNSVTEVKLTVTKLHPPLNGKVKSVSVELKKKRG